MGVYGAMCVELIFVPYNIFTPRNYCNKDVSFGLTYQLISFKFYFTYFKG